MWWLPEGAKGAMLSFPIRLQVNCPRFTIVRWNFAQGVFPLECARSFSLGCRSWQRLRPLLCHSLHFGMKRRRSVTVLAIPLFGSISARAFITSSDRSGTGKAARAASFVRKKLAPAASGAPCLGSDNLGSQLFFPVKGRTAAGPMAPAGRSPPFRATSRAAPGTAPLIQIKHRACSSRPRCIFLVLSGH